MGLIETINHLKHIMVMAKVLDQEYENKHKGTVYSRRRHVIMDRFKFYTHKLKQFGKGQVCLWYVILLDDSENVIYYPAELSEEDVKIMVELEYEPKTKRIELVRKINLGILEKLAK